MGDMDKTAKCIIHRKYNLKFISDNYLYSFYKYT